MPMPARGPGRPSLSNEALLDRALVLFLESGFERTSIDAICAAAGMAKRTFYQRYGDKLTFFKATLERAIEEWILPLEALEACVVDDLEETLLRVGRRLVTNVMSEDGIRLLRITNAESPRIPEIGAFTYEAGTRRTIEWLAGLFHRRLGCDAAEAHNAAIVYMYIVVGGPPTATAWGVTLDADEVDGNIRYAVHVLLHGLLPKTDGSAAPERKELPDSAAAELERLRGENEQLRRMLVDSMLKSQVP
ncbi:TetR/AcrR family transcriptional regulator [Novosphingobium sp. BL-8A]|uniref:TetR/AcrR family transcriptional regulator n=1 Tax=Novosphingobium sp. BL-8A TaxID=3127639 RepID=UPI0037576BFA